MHDMNREHKKSNRSNLENLLQQKPKSSSQGSRNPNLTRIEARNEFEQIKLLQTGRFHAPFKNEKAPVRLPPSHSCSASVFLSCFPTLILSPLFSSLLYVSLSPLSLSFFFSLSFLCLLMPSFSSSLSRMFPSL